jgi:urate oxidase
MTLIYNPAAFKHSLTELDVETAMATALVDELLEGFDNKYLVVGFDTNRNFIEVMYNLVGEDIANIFHAMKCRKEFLKKLQERGYYANFN